jgi:hypothetical protein
MKELCLGRCAFSTLERLFGSHSNQRQPLE